MRPGDMIGHFDGDDIGPALELLLLDDHLEEARKYSSSIACALGQLASSLAANPSVDVIVQGGDDLVAKWEDSTIDINQIEELRAAFHLRCGRTMSVGMGPTAALATLALRRAKLSGKNQIVIKMGSTQE